MSIVIKIECERKALALKDILTGIGFKYQCALPDEQQTSIEICPVSKKFYFRTVEIVSSKDIRYETIQQFINENPLNLKLDESIFCANPAPNKPNTRKGFKELRIIRRANRRNKA